jgi:hypothetical protein
LVTTKTVSDLVEPVDLVSTKTSTTNYFYKASSRKLSYVKNTIFNMVWVTPPWSDTKVVKPPVSEKEISKLSVTDTTTTAPPDMMDLKPSATEKVTTTSPPDSNELKPSASEREGVKPPENSVITTDAPLHPDSNELKPSAPDKEGVKPPENSVITTDAPLPPDSNDLKPSAPEKDE